MSQPPTPPGGCIFTRGVIRNTICGMRARYVGIAVGERGGVRAGKAVSVARAGRFVLLHARGEHGGVPPNSSPDTGLLHNIVTAFLDPCDGVYVCGGVYGSRSLRKPLRPLLTTFQSTHSHHADLPPCDLPEHALAPCRPPTYHSSPNCKNCPNSSPGATSAA